MRSKKFVNTITYSYSMESIDIFTNVWMIVNVPHDPLVAQSTYNVNELRFLDYYEQPRYVMYVMTNLRHHYWNIYRMTKNEDISNPFEVTERKTLAAQNIVDKNKYLTIFFQSALEGLHPVPD